MKNQLLLSFTLIISIFSFSQEIIMQNATISQCGTTFTDSGSTNANYDNDENFILTLCPEVSGDLVELVFSIFNTETQLDVMTIYNGNNINSPIIGTFSGGGLANNPGTIVADNTTGCLTVQFTTDGTNNTIGWLAEVNCVNSASFQIAPTCDGALITSVLNPGGTFAFNPVPADGAIIDTVTGTVTNGISGTTYTIEYTTNGNQPDSSTQSFTVLITPIANAPSDLEVCQEYASGFANFNLESNTQQILGGQDPSNFSVTYYASQTDADAQMNPLSSPYINTTNPQTIFALVSSNSSNCSSNIVTFNLIVNGLNINPFANDMLACGDGNGIGLFDLTQNEGQYTNGNTNLIITYHESSSDAFNNSNAIPQPNAYYNTIPYNQTIYIRITDATTGCFYASDDTVLYLNVNNLQVTQPTPLVAPDPDNDGFATFILTDKDAEITVGQTGLMVSYYETQADADNDVNPLSSPYNNIIANQQTVYVKVESATGDCTTFVQLVLLTEFVPFQVNPATLEGCDENEDGTEIFDLNPLSQQILDGLNASEYSIVYYETYDDAQMQTNAITDTFAYITNPNIQTIYAGVTEIATSEYVITTIDIVINQIPIIMFDDIYTICSGDTLELFPFTITQENSTYIWNTGEDTPTINVTQSGDYTVTITNNVTGCTNTDTTTVEVAFFPVIGTANNLTSCDPNQVYDLTTTIPEILLNLDPNEFTVTFYENTSDAANNVNAISNPSVYTTQNANQQITASVSSVNNDCSSLSFFDIITGNCPTTVTCGTVVNTNYCYAVNSQTTYTYTSADGSPLELTFNAGQVELSWDELIVLDSDGVTNLNAASPYGADGDLTGLTFASSGDTISFYVDSDGVFSCQTENYIAIDATVDCLDTTSIPNCDAVLITPQDLAVDVNENVDFSWTQASGFITGYFLTVTEADGTLFLDMVDVGYVTTYDVGTLNYDTQYFVSLIPYNTNGSATNCTDTSFTTRTDPNVIIDCASNQGVNTTFCYTNNETQQYNFASNDGSPLYIVFNSGMTENNFDELIVLDSDGVTNLNADNPYGLNDNGDLTGLTFTTTGDTATVYIQSDGSVISCTNDLIDFDVFCGSNLGFIQINAFLDENNDGVFNGNDTPFTNGFFTYEVNNDGSINTVNSNTGSFTITNQVETNSYDITFATNAGYENCFTIPTALFEDVTVANGNTVTIDFPVTEQMPCEDLAVYLVPFSAPRPGFNYWNDLIIENLGSTTIASGTVTFIHDPLVNYVAATPFGGNLTVTPTATGATVDFTNLLPGESKIIWFQLYTPPTVNLGEFVSSSVVYTTAVNDVVSENNVSQITQEVIGSYDPNDITESHGREIVYNDFVSSDEYLYYTIRFQNVGTAEAINVRIENTIDPLLDINTLQFIRATHDVVMMQTGNQLTWTFDNINLPAQSQDDFGSNGYVLYKIKPTAGYAIGTIIPNTAEIYFDFNAPVVTNTFETEFVEFALSVDEFTSNNFSLYPNPANNIVTIKLNNALRGKTSVEIIDVQGKQIREDLINDGLQEKTLDVSNLEAGLYFVKLKNATSELIKKLIIE